MKYLHLFKRSTKDLWSVGKKYYLLLFVQKFSAASITFLSFIYMTRVVQALSNQQTEEIFPLIVQYLVIFGILQVTTTLLEPYVDQEENLTRRQINDIPYKKMLRMQYHYADSAKINEQLNYIKISSMNEQSSLNVQNNYIPWIIDYFIRTVWALSLLTPLLRSPDANLNTAWAWVNSPWIFIILILGIAIVLFLQLSSSQESQKELESSYKESHHINNILNYELDILMDIESGKEIRLYQLEDQLQKNQTKGFVGITNWMKNLYYAGSKQQVLVLIVAQLLNYFTYAIIGIRVLLGLLPIGYIIQLSSALSQLLTNLPNLIQHVAVIFSSPQTLVDFYEFMDLPEETICRNFTD